MHSDRVVIITGAGGGMGIEFVRRFLANGDTVVACDVNEDALRTLGTNDRLRTLRCDISTEADCDRLAISVSEHEGRTDVLVNAAGYFPVRPFAEMTADEWRRVIDINLTGAFLMCKVVYPLMKGRGWGRIINIGSASTFEGVPGQVHYVAAKAGQFGLVRSLAREIGKEGITVNIVTPGLTLTPPVVANMPKKMITEQIERRAIPRDEHAADLVGAVFFLASPDAGFISGQTINVDGGKFML